MTDYKKGVVWNDITDPTENRSFAWGKWSGYTREGNDDFICAQESGIQPMIIDPDTLITKELWIVHTSTAENTVNPIREWGFMIILEEETVSPSQSVFQQIKGMGQDV